MSGNQIGGGVLSLGLDYPAMASIGVGFSGMEGWKFALDARYIDYSNTDGFNNTGFDTTTGAVQGFGWDSIMVYAFGAQYDLDDCVSFRFGYAMNDNPISKENGFFNVAAPGIIEQHASAGMTYCVSKDWYFDLTYRQGFENSLSSLMQNTSGPIEGRDVTSTLSTQSLLIGFRVKF